MMPEAPTALHVAYADPPYPGMAHRYGEEEIDWDNLIDALETFDGWALSCGSKDLAMLLPLCPGVRVLAWCKTLSFNAFEHPKFSWEPVLMRSPRQTNLSQTGRVASTRDWIACPASTNGFFGSKPPEFCGWLFECLGLEPHDHFYDLFEGSGAVTRAWKQWSSGAFHRPLFHQTGSREAR